MHISSTSIYDPVLARKTITTHKFPYATINDHVAARDRLEKLKINWIQYSLHIKSNLMKYERETSSKCQFRH